MPPVQLKDHQTAAWDPVIALRVALKTTPGPSIPIQRLLIITLTACLAHNVALESTPGPFYTTKRNHLAARQELV